MISQSLRNLFFKLRYNFKGVPFQIGKHTIRLDESLRRWSPEIEWAVQEMIAKHLSAGDIFIDIGANFGLHTLYAASLVGTQGHVFAFEPVPSNLNLLRKNINLSGVEEQVTVEPKAVSNSLENSLEFYLPTDEVAVTASLRPDPGTVGNIQVANVRLDDYWSNINKAVKLIKIDVEGAELEVLRGAANLLKQWKPSLIIEVHGFAFPNFGTSVAEFRSFLQDLGYQEHRLAGEQFDDGDGDDYFQAIYLQ